MTWVRKWLILIHRYLGMALSLLLAVWFVSGIAMIYARGMPRLTPDVRLKRLPPIDLASVRRTPTQALEKSELDRPGRTTLLTVMGRPAYRFGGRDAVTVFADTGELLEIVGETEALKIASGFMNLPESQFHYEGELAEPDQWTITESGQLPMHKFTVDDHARTELYVSEASAEVGLMTTRGTRALAWVAAIPHWLYFAPLRLNGPVWRQAVLWTAGVGAVLTLLGMILAFTQFSTKYTGLMRWHYITGIIFGVFCLTFAFSGMLSMEPFYWASSGGTGNRINQTLAGGVLDLTAFPAADPSKWSQVLPGRPVKEIEFRRIQGQPFYLVRDDKPEPLLVSANSMEIRREPFPMDSIMSRVKQGYPDVPITESTVLSEYDSYYYPRERKPPLPVLRVKFADPDATWFYIDPHMSQVAGSMTRRERLQRWIYNGFHSLDFNFWYYQGPAWQISMVALNAGGALLSTIGVILSIKRLGRGFKRTVKGAAERRQNVRL